jgi:hypothetical protein
MGRGGRAGLRGDRVLNGSRMTPDPTKGTTMNMAHFARIAAVAVALASAVTTATHAQQQTTPVTLTETRDMRFCEVLVINDGFVDIYNTSGLNACPAEAWDSLDPAALAAQMGVDAIQKNGPHHWVMDSQTIGFGDTRTFNGIEARWGARAPLASLGGSEGATPYQPFKTCKDQTMVYDAGQKVWEMLDADGNVYVLQAHEEQFPIATLDDLGAQMTSLPEGWSFRGRVLDSPLVLDLKASACNTGIGDEFHQYYTLESGGT